MDNYSGVGVLDKSVAILTALEEGPMALADLVPRTGLARPTAYRLACALEAHLLVDRDESGRFRLGPGLARLSLSAGESALVQAARPILDSLCAATGESTQAYRREGDQRRCLAVAEPSSGLRDTVPVGAALTMRAGSAAQVLLAWSPAESIAASALADAFEPSALEAVRLRGWAHSVGQRQEGVASVSAPVFNAAGQVIAAISVSGPTTRLGDSPGTRWGPQVLAAAAQLTSALGGRSRP